MEISRDQSLSRLKIRSKILEQKVSLLPVDVSSLQQLHKMHGESTDKNAESADVASHVIASDLLWVCVCVEEGVLGGFCCGVPKLCLPVRHLSFRSCFGYSFILQCLMQRVGCLTFPIPSSGTMYPLPHPPPPTFNFCWPCHVLCTPQWHQEAFDSICMKHWSVPYNYYVSRGVWGFCCSCWFSQAGCCGWQWRLCSDSAEKGAKGFLHHEANNSCLHTQLL